MRTFRASKPGSTKLSIESNNEAEVTDGNLAPCRGETFIANACKGRKAPWERRAAPSELDFILRPIL